MPDNLTIPPVGTPSPPAAQPAVPSDSASPDAHAASSANLPNPYMHLDVAVGLVVIEFSSHDGTVSTTIPTAQQLEAYRTGVPLDPSQATAATVASTQAPLASRVAATDVATPPKTPTSVSGIVA